MREPAKAPKRLDHWIARLRSLEWLLVVTYAVAISHPITYPWICLIAGLVTWGAISALSLANHSFRFERPPLILPLAVFALAVTVSGAVSGGLKEALASLSSLRTFLVYFWAYQAFVVNKPLKSYAMQVLLCIGALAGIWGTIQQRFNFHPVGFQYLQGTGFLATPMQYAGLMQMFGLIAVAILLKGAYRNFLPVLNNRYVFAAIALCNCLGLIFACERSAWLGFAVAMAIVVGIVSRRLLVLGAVASLIVGAVAWYTVPVFKTRLEPLLSGKGDTSTQARLIVWKRAWELFESKPAFGVGPRAFPRIYLPEAIVQGYSTDLNHAHSNYLQMLSTMGATGLLAYLYLCFATLKLCGGWLRARQRTSLDAGSGESGDLFCFEQATALGLLGSTISLMVAGIFEYNFGTGQVRLAQWFLLALVSRHGTRSEASER